VTDTRTRRRRNIEFRRFLRVRRKRNCLLGQASFAFETVRAPLAVNRASPTKAGRNVYFEKQPITNRVARYSSAAANHLRCSVTARLPDVRNSRPLFTKYGHGFVYRVYIVNGTRMVSLTPDAVVFTRTCERFRMKIPIARATYSCRAKTRADDCR